ncbi:MAG TPA: septum site-determining protein MinC [Burkholderiales bacterium]|nr:septum site-determining protein MinC [Burkholderiales bacterium]
MLSNTIKLNQASFEYYLLQINSQTKIEDIKSKFKSLKKLDKKNNTIVLSLNDVFVLNDLNKMLDSIKSTGNEYGINIHSILHNKYSEQYISNENKDYIFGIKVLDLASSTKLNPVSNKTLIYDDPVRSGMRVENDGDIIVTSFVSDNAEIVATGSIHIYGEAKGRLIAGSNGNKEARIFTTSFNAELIAIGGIFRALENKLLDNINHKMVQIHLDEKSRLHIKPLN